MHDIKVSILFDASNENMPAFRMATARIDFKKRCLTFAPLQGITAQRSRQREVRASLNTIVFKPAGSRSTHIRSEALIEALKAYNGGGGQLQPHTAYK